MSARPKRESTPQRPSRPKGSASAGQKGKPSSWLNERRAGKVVAVDEGSSELEEFQRRVEALDNVDASVDLAARGTSIDELLEFYTTSLTPEAHKKSLDTLRHVLWKAMAEMLMKRPSDSGHLKSSVDELKKENEELKARIKAASLRERHLSTSLAQEKSKNANTFEAGANQQKQKPNFSNAYYKSPNQSSKTYHGTETDSIIINTAKETSNDSTRIASLLAELTAARAALERTETELAKARLDSAQRVPKEALEAANESRDIAVADLGSLMVEHSALVSLCKNNSDMIDRLQSPIH